MQVHRNVGITDPFMNIPTRLDLAPWKCCLVFSPSWDALQLRVPLTWSLIWGTELLDDRAGACRNNSRRQETVGTWAERFTDLSRRIVCPGRGSGHTCWLIVTADITPPVRLPHWLHCLQVSPSLDDLDLSWGNLHVRNQDPTTHIKAGHIMCTLTATVRVRVDPLG